MAKTHLYIINEKVKLKISPMSSILWKNWLLLYILIQAYAVWVNIAMNWYDHV